MKKIILSVLTAVGITFNGCSLGTSIDNLITPPKLSVEQEQIYNTLKDAAGQNISLKYPKSGNYLSAFIIEDIDSDGGSEAIVFYEKTGFSVDENILRINILDQIDGKWRSVCDTPAEGSEIEKVMISKLGSNDRINVVIGSSLMNRSEKSLAVYTYNSESSMIENTFSASYTYADILDLDSDDENELLLLNGSSTSNAEAVAYKLDNNGKYHVYKTELNGSFNDFDRIVYGSIDDETIGLYIDAVSGMGTIQTDIIYMNSQGLKSVFADSEESKSTIRPSGCNTTDIDSDGIYEIPVQKLFPGYTDATESEQIKMTNWLCLKNNKLVRKYSSYYSVSDGYAFIIPEKWEGKVTVKLDTLNDEIVFCKYINGTVGEDLLRIYTAEDSASREDRISAGYQLLCSKGEAFYMAYACEDKEMGINTGELALYFKKLY